SLRYTFDIECLFVDGDAPPGGDGTFEHPFNDLAAALAITPCQCIYVLGGTFVGQFPAPQCPLLGGACDQLVPTAQGVSIALPPLNTSYPVLTNPGGFIIVEFGTSADIYIRGFELRNGTIHTFISGVGTNVVSLTCNRFTETAVSLFMVDINTLIVEDNEFEYTQTSALGSWQTTATNTMVRNNTFTSIGSAKSNQMNIASFTNSSLIFDNNLVRLSKINAAGGVVHPSIATNFLFANNDIVVDAPGTAAAILTSPNLSSNGGTIQNNIIVNTTGSIASFLSTESNYTGMLYTGNTSSTTNDVVFELPIVGISMCASLDSNVANSYQFDAVAGSVINVTQSLADLATNNVGTVAITGAGPVNFDTGCVP
ncbi:MAG: hypothetical protein H7A40_06505, partial [Chlamydiales bacterium]|nr:hypothetical protein [Chlamydiales bacterium]